LTSGGTRPPPHALDRAEVAGALGVSLAGLDDIGAAERLHRFGANRLRPPVPPSRWKLFARQFASPVIYILLGAAGIAVALRRPSDAAFIGAVLMLNAIIGFANEARADREVRALTQLVRMRARVRRGGRVLDIESDGVVPGDLLLLESGSRVAADVRLVETQGLRIDESLLTGESLPVDKDASLVLPAGTPLADRRNMACGGSLVASGRGLGLVVATAEGTEVGAIAGELAEIPREPPPLLRRMERFARIIGASVIGLAGLLVGLGLARGESFAELLLGAVALAVSAVPEGLPIALTVALAVAVSRMARRRVVVRHLPAAEALGSCGVIATDKTGTLTRNELTVERVVAGGLACEITGVGYPPQGEVLCQGKPVFLAEQRPLSRLLRAVCLANEASLSQREGMARWEWSGDPTDVALLSLGLKAGCDPIALRETHETVASIPFEPERRYAASFHRDGGGTLVCVKGAPERVIDLCVSELEARTGATESLDRRRALQAVEALMREGYRVLAVADDERPEPMEPISTPGEPSGLVFLGLVAMTDPPREGVREALASCRRAGIRVVMITGDHSTTAAAIAARIGLGEIEPRVLTGSEVAALEDEALVARIIRCDVVARATPADKLRVVRAWQQRGALVAVTGDGVNDAPALRQADLGVAMGRAGTDVAREAADLIITDDDFSSIVEGIEEGRVAYENIRKATYLLVSTGAGEVVVVTAALALGFPLPFTAVQLLWLNLVTNGIQDVALVFEPAEPHILERPPRPPDERVFDRLMVERTLLAGGVLGGIGLACWAWWAAQERPVAEARNLMVQLFVLFEILHIGNARSERIALFRLSPLRNRLLLLGTLAAFGVHLIALYTPFLQELLGVKPPMLREWATLIALAAPIVVVIEAHKWWTGRRSRGRVSDPEPERERLDSRVS
jgi:magnesium-transporting ATPase (P-type)